MRADLRIVPLREIPYSIAGMDTVRCVLLGSALLLAGSFSLWGQTAGAPPKAVVTVVEVEKIVEAQPRGTAWRPATVGMNLSVGDKVSTGQYSRAVLQFGDLSPLRLDEFTDIEITQVATAIKPARMGVKRGGLYFLNRGQPRKLEIRAAGANGALKGTELIVRVTGNRALFALLEGELELSNQFNAKSPLTITSGEMAVVEVGRAPRKTAMIDATNLLQWCLYYPGVLDPAEFADRKSAALEAYRAGDLPRALKAQTMVEARPLRAALILSSGQVESARAVLASLPPADRNRLALERMIAAVQFQEWTGGEPVTASEWVAESYHQQSRANLEAALAAAQKAMELSPGFGFAWVRAAEMEFSFGRTLKAVKLLDRGLELAPDNAQAHALRGFLLAAENRTGAAREEFDRAIALDGALGNAWLGRGLTSIRQGREEEGRRDLQTAAILEPNRSALRSYLGKAFSEVGNREKANLELRRAKELDDRDPLPWLYSAIQRKQENRYNEAIAELEKSIELNGNRSVYRSKFLLDDDRAIRGTNLAAIYENNGMTEQSVREAVRAVDANYASAPAHLFLANSYDALRDTSGVLTRYEAATFNELLLSHLLSPVGGGPLSQFVSQQEYSKLFTKDGLGFASDTTYLSTGEIRATASQFGTVGNLSYALDGFYNYTDGTRTNSRLSNAGGFATFKLQLGPQDTLFFQTEISDTESGDVAQRYDPSSVDRNIAARTLDFREKQDPGLLLLGLTHEWSPQSRTLVLLSRLASRQIVTALQAPVLSLREDIQSVATGGVVDSIAFGPSPRPHEAFAQVLPFAGLGTIVGSRIGGFDLDYRSSFAIYSAEIEHIVANERGSLIAGGRYQRGEFDTSLLLTNFNNGDARFTLERGNFDQPPANQHEEVDFDRLTLYLHGIWHVAPWLSLTGGIAYDTLNYPQNFRDFPINGNQDSRHGFSPKAGLIFQPWRNTVVRAAYSQAVSGASFDESIRLEPTQVAGFVQSDRSLISESLIGAVAGSEFKRGALSLEQKLPSRTYFGIELNASAQDLDRTTGIFRAFETSGGVGVVTPASSLEARDRYKEASLIATVNQLVGDRWSLGARYRYTYSELRTEFEGIDQAIPVAGENARALLGLADRKGEARFHALSFHALYNHPNGFFARGEANWYRQRNEDYANFRLQEIGDIKVVQRRMENQGLAGTDFWQFNLFAGWRFNRNQCEIGAGVLNLLGKDYHLNPLNPSEELPRDRTAVIRCKLQF